MYTFIMSNNGKMYYSYYDKDKGEVLIALSNTSNE